MVQRERRRGDTVQTQTAYFISSLPPDAERLLAAARSCQITDESGSSESLVQ
jgi:hypothetical protein